MAIAGPSSRPASGRRTDEWDSEDPSEGSSVYDDDDDDFPPEIYSEPESDEEWRPSDASDAAGSGADEEYTQSKRSRAAISGLRGGIPDLRNVEATDGQRSRLTAQQSRRMAMDALGSEAWRDIAQQRREQTRLAHRGDEEHEVEADELNRLMEGIGGVGSGPALSADDVDEPMDGQALGDEIMAASGFKSQKKRMRRTMPQTAISPEVSRLLQDANIAYVNQSLDEAIEKLQEVIRIEPTIRAAWATLASCFHEQDLIEKEIQAKIIEASLTPHATELWISLAHKSAECGLDRQSVYCLDQAIRTSEERDKSDVLDAMWDKACLLRDLGDAKEAVVAFKALLKLRPHNSEVLGEVIPLLLSIQQRRQAIELLEASRDFNMEHFPDPSRGEGLRFASYRGSEIATLADLLLLNNEALSALHALRQGARWLAGRGTETFWDEVIEDDREFDPSREDGRTNKVEYGRRVEMAPVYEPLDLQFRLRLGHARLRMGDKEEAVRHYEAYLEYTDPADYSEQYLELADVFIENNGYDQALNILGRMVELDFLQVPAVYVKIGICHQATGNPEQAASCFEAVLQAEPEDIQTKYRLAQTYEEMGKVAEAVQLVNEVMQAREDAALEDGMAEGQSVDGYDPLLSTRATMSLFDEVEATGISRPKAKGRRRRTLRPEDRERMERAREEEASVLLRRLRAREADIFIPGWWQSNVVIGLSNGSTSPADIPRRYGHLQGESEESLVRRLTATRDWLDLAGRLIDSFRSTPQLFMRKKKTGKRHYDARATRDPFHGHQSNRDVTSQASHMLARIRDKIVTESVMVDEMMSPARLQNFRGIDNEEWIELFMKSAFVQTKIGNLQGAYELLDHVRESIIVDSDSRKSAIELCRTACAMYARDHAKTFEVIRWLPYRWQFNNEALRITTSIAHVAGFYGLDCFSEARVSKMIVRRSRIHEAIASGRKHQLAEATGRYIVLGKLRDSTTVGKGGVGAASGVGDESSTSSPRGAMLHDDDDDDDEVGTEIGDDDDDDEEGEDEGEGDESEEGGRPRIRNAAIGSGTSVAKVKKEKPALEPPPTKHNPMGEAHYSYFLFAAGSYQAALAYALRAYARAPQDALACLLVAVASFGRISNRQVDNRHHLFIQGLSFLSLYRALRCRAANDDPRPPATQNAMSSDGEEIDAESPLAKSTAWIEAKYNQARALHSLGLLHMAVPWYEAVLRAHGARERVSGGAKREAAGFDCYREAAWNLSLIYSLNGNPRGARGLVEKYLTVN